ncbi:MAG: GntR family transcriptional regulator [Thermodesulfobacteriota bacterium]
MAKVKREDSSNKVYGALKGMIADYRFQPGVRLKIEDLAKELGATRTSVSEAIRRLEQEGLVKNMPNRGIIMVEMTLEKSFELFQVRAALETLVGKLAAENIDDRTVTKMAKCLEEQLEVVKKGDLIRYSQLDFDFHSMIYEMTRNSFLEELLDSIKAKMRPFDIHLKPILTQLYQDHAKIFEALRSKNPEAAEKAFARHNEKIINRIKEQIGADLAF